MPPIDQESDEDPIRSAATHRDASGRFYDRDHLALLAALRVRVGNIELACDLTAEVLAAAIASREASQIRGTGCSPA